MVTGTPEPGLKKKTKMLVFSWQVDLWSKTEVKAKWVPDSQFHIHHLVLHKVQVPRFDLGLTQAQLYTSSPGRDTGLNV